MTKVFFYGEECDLVVGRYAQGGRIRLDLRCDTGEPMATCTVNLPHVDIPEGCAFIKDYSENEGMVEALKEAGVIVGDPIKSEVSGFVIIDCYRLSLEPDPA